MGDWYIIKRRNGTERVFGMKHHHVGCLNTSKAFKFRNFNPERGASGEEEEWRCGS